jgi:hypothetical protein
MVQTVAETGSPTVSSNGFVFRAKVHSGPESVRYLEAARAALATPLSDDDFVRTRDALRQAPPLRTWASAAEAAVADCIGELGTRAPSAPTKALVEGWRASVFSSQNVSFAAVGSRAILDVTENTIRGWPAWPKAKNIDDPWPPADVFGLTRTGDGARTLSVALRIADAARALEAAKTLGKSDSALVRHAASLETTWTVERVAGTVRARGACLRIDLRPEGPAPPPGVAADVAAMVLDEATRALREAPGLPGSLDSGVLESFDPRDAAAVAAWRALGGRLSPGAARSFVSYGSNATSEPGGDAAFAKALETGTAARQKSTLDAKRSLETGQGETWILLGSPCATLTESADDAGASALLVRSIALAHAESEGVHVEPWISANGVGLLAHGSRASPDEPPARQAERVANALGRALSGSRVDVTAAAAARAELEVDLNPQVQPLWSTALGVLAPRRVSALDPRGTWQSVTSIPIHSVEFRRLAFIRGPLRLAVLANGAAADANVELGLERWLKPERRGQSRCPASPPLVASTGEYIVDTQGASQGSRALVAVPIAPAANEGLPVEAEWTLHLLNRRSGWLDRSVRLPGVAVAAEALLVGGTNGGALIVQVSAPEGRTREAVAQVRALFGRLADGAVSAEDVQLARSDAADEQAAAATDPRHRIISLWLGRGPVAPPDLASLRRFQHQTLAPERHVVVIGKNRL